MTAPRLANMYLACLGRPESAESACDRRPCRAAATSGACAGPAAGSALPCAALLSSGASGSGVASGAPALAAAGGFAAPLHHSVRASRTHSTKALLPSFSCQVLMAPEQGAHLRQLSCTQPW